MNKRSLLVALAFMALVAQAAESPEVTEEKVQAALSELEKLAEQQFQAHYGYTNFGLTEAGVAAAKAAGKSWEDVAAG